MCRREGHECVGERVMSVQRAWLNKLTSHARMLYLVVRLNQRHWGEAHTLDDTCKPSA